MPDDGREFAPRPPSRFHDEARRRVPSHDRMQQEVLAFLRERRLACLPDTPLIERHVEGEYPLHKNGQVVSFVDAIEILSICTERFVSAFEIKPKIDTTFGIVRQVKAQRALLWRNLKPKHCEVYVVVPINDPLLSELRAEWPHTWAWGYQVSEEEWTNYQSL